MNDTVKALQAIEDELISAYLPAVLKQAPLGMQIYLKAYDESSASLASLGIDLNDFIFDTGITTPQFEFDNLHDLYLELQDSPNINLTDELSEIKTKLDALQRYIKADLPIIKMNDQNQYTPYTLTDFIDALDLVIKQLSPVRKEA